MASIVVRARRAIVIHKPTVLVPQGMLGILKGATDLTLSSGSEADRGRLVFEVEWNAAAVIELGKSTGRVRGAVVTDVEIDAVEVV